ncbi:DUF6941 family protein [Nocardioides pocheonensis]|uniref:Uncharacterized protein n=1 Tax=Nocardioides pocheonensis TaxID=661485 RepID=A0A3N0GV87_9ACTN|nr:hypothetical protein [Nocardioides pocheonensis]RNM16319.1 hypothetical protein EFL26_05065 [Nocardioides pocheonensis]
MKAVLLLADAAEVTNGKVSSLGAGWSVTATPTPPMALVAVIDVPWDQTNQKHQLVIELRDADGRAVSFQRGPEGQPLPALHVEAEFEVGRPPGVPAGTPMRHQLAIALAGGVPLAAGEKYEFHLTIDGEDMDSWLATFLVRP